MEHFYSTYFLSLDVVLSNYFTALYDIVQYYTLLILNNCPFYYQMVYGYAPVTYLLIRRKFRKNNYVNYFDKSNFNWLFFNVKLILFRATKLIIVYNYFEVFFKKLYYYYAHRYYSNYKYKIKFVKVLFTPMLGRNVWKPIFKKYSYFGVFAFLRSKWFK